MFIDHALDDNSAHLARRIVDRGLRTVGELLTRVCGTSEFAYVACPDFSISLRQRRLILGLPIGGYVNWHPALLYPLQLDLNSCGVHVVRLHEAIGVDEFVKRVYDLKQKMDRGDIVLGGMRLKWNFSRRNHFMNLYAGSDGDLYCICHAGAETKLFDVDYLNDTFSVCETSIDGRTVPYIKGDDVYKYWDVARDENERFLGRHELVFQRLFGDKFDLVCRDQHFGMIALGEVLMGCSKVRPGARFALLSRPFESAFLAVADEPPDDVASVTDGWALVPHGLGMTVPDGIIDIAEDTCNTNYVVVTHENGSRMITDTLEYVGISYRNMDVLPEMQRRGGFHVTEELKPVACLKL